MLTAPKHLLVLHGFGKGFQGYLRYLLPRDQSEADRSIMPWILLLALLEECHWLSSRLHKPPLITMILQRLLRWALQRHGPACPGICGYILSRPVDL